MVLGMSASSFIMGEVFEDNNPSLTEVQPESSTMLPIQVFPSRFTSFIILLSIPSSLVSARPVSTIESVLVKEQPESQAIMAAMPESPTNPQSRKAASNSMDLSSKLADPPIMSAQAAIEKVSTLFPLPSIIHTSLEVLSQVSPESTPVPEHSPESTPAPKLNQEPSSHVITGLPSGPRITAHSTTNSKLSCDPLFEKHWSIATFCTA